MVCLADAEYIQAVITDTIGDGPKKQSNINLAPSKLVDNVFNEVALDFHYQPDAFELSIENENEEPIVLNEHKGKTLGEIGVKFDQNSHARLVISSLKTPKNVCFATKENDVDETDDNSYLNYCKSKVRFNSRNKNMNLSVNETANAVNEEYMLKFDFVLPSYSLLNDFNNTTRDSTNTTKSNDSCKMEVKVIESNNYVGLVNQAMTCYLNSLLQALYMTPEFRNALYNWEFDGQNETRSIPFQLQKLFLNLQTSTKSAVETTDLTTSFGWQGSEAWQQHDIQELCRVMFDALEQKFKSTKQANLINDLYEGKMLDYVKCLECSTEKSREDTFLDIPLPVRPFGSAEAYNSVEEALRAFVQPETLNGNNQYFCEKCNKKCDAHKGLKFTKFPYLLTLHLKRFDFDYNTMHRIKLNDKVVFPEILNLNSFIFPSINSAESEVMEERETVVKCDDSSTTSDSGSALDDESCQGADNLPTLNGQEDANHEEDEGPLGIDMTEAKGPYIYELFSIMIHSGSASGGHYYAYIKDFAKNQWFCFNDMNVSKITEEDIKKTYGGGPQRGYYSSAYSSSTNAYMLMYRQIEKERNCNAMTLEDFPPHLQKLLQQMREKEECDRISKEKENDQIKMKVYCELPIQNQLMYTKIAAFIDSTLEEVTKDAYTRFKLEGIVPLEDCRLVSYNKNQDYIDCSFESNELRLCDITNSKFIVQNDWLLEIKQPGSQFQTYKPGGVNMKVFVINLETEEVDGPVNVRVNAGETVGEFRTHLAHLLNMDLNTMKVVKETYSNEPQLLEDDDAPMKFDPSFNGYKIYVSQAIDEDPEQPFILSHLHKVIDRFVHIISINIVLPDTNLSTLESLSIPPLDFNQNLDKIELAGGDRMNSSPNLTVSPQPGGICSEGFGDQSNSEDSSLSDSDRTLVGDAPGDCLVLLSSSSNSPADQHMASPSDPAEDTYNHEVFGNPSEDMNWEMEPEPLQRCTNYYFKVTSCMSSPDSSVNDEANRFCKVLVDKRMTLCRFKKHLEPIVGVPVDYFKIYRQYPNQDDEWSRLKDTLGTAKDGERLIVKLGRVLKKDEYSGKIYHFTPNGTNIFNLLFEHIITKGQTVGQIKRDIILQAKKQHMLDIPYTKSCLRKKSWKNPTKIYLDEQKFVDDVNLGKNFELCIQELEDCSEKMTSPKQLAVFVRRWNPATLTLSPFSEIVLDSSTMDELKKKVSEKSGIPLENVDIAFLKLTFPCDINVLEIHDLEWNPSVTLLENWPLQIYEDGNVFFYRDNREALKELTQDEKKEINQKENARLGRYSSKTYSPGKERGLKIYLDTSPSKPKETCSD